MVAGTARSMGIKIKGTPPFVNEDAGSVVETAFGLNIEDGDDELDQTLTFNLTKTGGLLQFSVPPSIEIHVSRFKEIDDKEIVHYFYLDSVLVKNTRLNIISRTMNFYYLIKDNKSIKEKIA